MAFNIGQITRGVNTHKPMERAYAVGILSIARDALDSADRIQSDNPLQATRERLRERITILRGQVDKETADPISETLADPIRTAAVQSFIELNAAAEGEETSDANSLWEATAAAAAELPETLGSVAGQVAGGAATAAGEAAAGFIGGLFKSIGGVALLLGGGYLLYLYVKKKR